MACKAPFSRKNLLIGLVMLFIGAEVVASQDNMQSKKSVAASPHSPSQVRWIPLIAGSNPDKPKVVVTESGPSRIRLKIEVPGMWCKETKHEGESFTKITIPEYGFTSEIGKSAIPVIRKMLWIPYGAEASVAVINVKERELALKELGIEHWIDPLQPSAPISGPKPDLVIDRSHYQADIFYPNGLAKVVDTGTVRGQRFVQVEIAPIRYNPRKGKVRICSNIDFEVKLNGSDIASTQQMLKRYASPPYDALFRSLFSNYQSYENLAGDPSLPISDTGPPPPKPPVGYLIITPASFYDALTPLVGWKTMKGFHVTVAKTSEIGYTKEEIKQYIKNAYDTWDIPPTYVLLAADADSIPTFTSDNPPEQPRSAVDLYYVTMSDVSDRNCIADILRGRLPAKNPTELTGMVNKILEYEKGPFGDSAVGDPDSVSWMNRFCLVKGSRDVGDIVLPREVPMECMPDSMQYDSLDKYADTIDIAEMINEGRSLITYSDHGGTSLWGPPPKGGPYFHQHHVQNLTNQKKYPFVLSFCCVTGCFNFDECFGETWVKEENKGAIAFWGASCLTGFPENDLTENGIYKALCYEGIYTVSGATDRGLWNLRQAWGITNPDVKRQCQGYNILGDPSVDLWMKVCDTLAVDYARYMLPAPTIFRVGVESNGAPVQDALVCLLKEDEVFATGYTGVHGDVDLYIEPEDTGTMYVTITAHNYRPHEGTVCVSNSLLRGDVNMDGVVDIGDVVYLINYLWKGGPVPIASETGDVNCDGIVNIGDVVYLINYLFKGGPPPSC